MCAGASCQALKCPSLLVETSMVVWLSGAWQKHMAVIWAACGAEMVVFSTKLQVIQLACYRVVAVGGSRKNIVILRKFIGTKLNTFRWVCLLNSVCTDWNTNIWKHHAASVPLCLFIIFPQFQIKLQLSYFLFSFFHCCQPFSRGTEGCFDHLKLLQAQLMNVFLLHNVQLWETQKTTY